MKALHVPIHQRSSNKGVSQAVAWQLRDRLRKVRHSPSAVFRPSFVHSLYLDPGQERRQEAPRKYVNSLKDRQHICPMVFSRNLVSNHGHEMTGHKKPPGNSAKRTAARRP